MYLEAILLYLPIHKFSFNIVWPKIVNGINHCQKVVKISVLKCGSAEFSPFLILDEVPNMLTFSN